MNTQDAIDLRDAEIRASQAADLKDRFNKLLEVINREFPANTFRMTNPQKIKARGIDKALERLNKAITLPFAIKDRIAKDLLQEEKKAEKERQKKLDEQINAEFLDIRNKAVEFCLTKGLVFGVDFNIEDAIDVADHIVFESEKEKAILEIEKTGPISFSGQNCDDCSGWDGVSHRCNCGNRRVEWVLETGDFRGMWIGGEAF